MNTEKNFNRKIKMLTLIEKMLILEKIMSKFEADVKLTKKMVIEAEDFKSAVILLNKGRGKQVKKTVDDISFKDVLPTCHYYRYNIARNEKLKVDKLEQSTSHFTLKHGRVLPETVHGNIYVDDQRVLSFVLGQSLTVSSYNDFKGGISSVKIDYFSGKMEVTWADVRSNKPFEIYLDYEYKDIEQETNLTTKN